MVITTELVVIVGSVAGIVALAVGLNVHSAMQHRRLRTLLPTLHCPGCDGVYGEGVLSKMTRTHVLVYHAPGYNLYGVTCSHCSRESRYTLDGKLDELQRFSRGTHSA
jgi:hypothetical protein